MSDQHDELPAWAVEDARRLCLLYNEIQADLDDLIHQFPDLYDLIDEERWLA